MATKLDSRILVGTLIDLKDWYSGFRWESEVWSTVGNRRSPYRVLVLFGLSPRTNDAYLTEMCQLFFDRFPDSEALTHLDRCGTSAADDIVRKGQRPFINSLSQLLDERGAVPRDVDSLLKVTGVGEKVAECVLAYGWGEDALPVDGNVYRVVNRILGSSGSGASRNVKVIREQLKWAYRERSVDLKNASIAMVDTHEILRLHAQTCCGRTPDCSRCPLTVCRSRKQRCAVNSAIVNSAAWDDWRELLLEPIRTT